MLRKALYTILGQKQTAARLMALVLGVAIHPDLGRPVVAHTIGDGVDAPSPAGDINVQLLLNGMDSADRCFLGGD
jgi:hypothetical protein